jgi:hypothetical protein
VAEVPEAADLAVMGVDLSVRVATMGHGTGLAAADEGGLGRAAAFDEWQVPVHECSIVGEHEPTMSRASDSSGVKAGTA